MIQGNDVGRKIKEMMYKSMKKIKLHTSVIMIAVLVMALSIGVSAVSTTIYADYARATASLTCKIRLKAVGSDSASAIYRKKIF